MVSVYKKRGMGSLSIKSLESTVSMILRNFTANSEGVVLLKIIEVVKNLTEFN